MEFRMLGPLEAWHDGAPVPLGDQQQRYVLVVLLLHANKPISPERLTEIVWPGKADRRALVRGYINKLRNAFRDAPDVTIETSATGYILRIDADAIDLVRFERLVEAARTSDPRRAVEQLRAAVDLWRGRFLEDIDIDRVGGADVVSPDDSYFDVVGDLAELELGIGDHRSARDRLRRVLPPDPANQRYAELLMRALIAGNDRVGAIRVFQAVRAALADIGFEPGTVLRNLAARAERGDPGSSLPSRPGGFTGRAAELAEIESAATAPGERRAVWVSGAPGVGKTGLAVEAAHRLRDRFPDGQILVRLNGFTPNVAPATVSDALTAVLTELGVPAEQIPPTEGRKQTLYQAELYGTRTLVVLDNALSPDQVRPLLPEARDCFAIVTSRHMGEPDTGQNIRLGPLPDDDAVELFHALSDRTRLRGRTADVARLVHRCNHLPMPIRLAAALFGKHDTWSLDHLLRLMEETDHRQGGENDAVAMHVSYQQLHGPQQHVFRLIGHLPGPDLGELGAAALAGEDVATTRMLLHDLHEVCLLEEVAPHRYQMLDALKEFAARQPAGDRADALLRLLDFYLVTLTAAVGAAYPFDDAYPPPRRTSPVAVTFASGPEALRWISEERDCLVAAIRYAAEHALPGHAWRLAVLCWRQFNTANRLGDWMETMELARRTIGPGEEDGEAHVLLKLATAHDRIGRLDEARELATSALAKWTRLGDVRGEAAALCSIAIATMQLGEPDEAAAHFEAALEKYRQCDDRRGQAHALSMLGLLNESRGDLDTALAQQQAAVPMLREIGHRQGLAHTLNNLGSTRLQLGLLDDALSDHLEAHQLAEEIGDDCVAAYALTNIGNVHRQAGRIPEARRHHELAVKIAATMSDANLLTQLHRDRGETALAGGDHVEALRMFSAALDQATRTGSHAHLPHAHLGVAQAMHALGRHAQAVPHWAAAESSFAAVSPSEANQVRADRAALSCDCRLP